jgi:hypothetical protein
MDARFHGRAVLRVTANLGKRQQPHLKIQLLRCRLKI